MAALFITSGDMLADRRYALARDEASNPRGASAGRVAVFASVDAAADVVPGTPPTTGCVGPCGSTLQDTGIFGPWALTVGVALMVVAAAVRLAPLVGGRLRSIR